MKPDDHLTNDSPVAPADVFESPREQHIVHTSPSDNTPEPEDDPEAFNEFRRHGESLDLIGAHGGPGGAVAYPGGIAGAGSVSAQGRPFPMWAIVVGILILVWAAFYLGTYSGGFQGDVFNADPNYKPSGPSGPVDPVVASVKRGHGIFTANCLQCHQADGNGIAGQYPPLAGSEWVLGDAPKRLPQILLHGIQGAIHVKGNVYNNAMPPWGTVLTDKQIADVLSYVRGELGGNKAGPVTEPEVADARKQSVAHTDSWSEAELLAIPAGPLEGPGTAAPAGAPPGAPSLPAGNNPSATGAGGKPAAADLGQGPAASAAPKP